MQWLSKFEIVLEFHSTARKRLESLYAVDKRLVRHQQELLVLPLGLTYG